VEEEGAKVVKAQENNHPNIRVKATCEREFICNGEFSKVEVSGI